MVVPSTSLPIASRRSSSTRPSTCSSAFPARNEGDVDGLPPALAEPPRERLASARVRLGAQGINTRRYRVASSSTPTVASSTAMPVVHCSTAWAIVPVKPNELTPPSAASSWLGHSASRRDSCAICTSSTLATSSPKLAITRALSTRSCAFGATRPGSRCTASLSRPLAPAAGSA